MSNIFLGQIEIIKILVVYRQVYEGLVMDGTLVPKPEVRPPTVPMDYSWAQELGLIRKPASFISAICDERGQELTYAGMKISDVFKVRCRDPSTNSFYVILETYYNRMIFS